jgi:CPA2 family monovalent cation:H+ antiporter-2
MRCTLIAIAGLSETLLELSALFALCVLVGVLFQRIRIPAVVGFLFAGAAIGPNGLALVRHPEMVEQLAELGVVMLLFTVGTELSITRLAHLRRAIFLGGGLQLASTIGLGALAAAITGMAAGRAVFLGFMLALSSTAAITKLLAERRELNAPASRLAIAVCVAQDLAVVPMLVLLPILGGSSTGVAAALVETVNAMALLGGLTAIAWFLVPRILDVVARTRSRELYLLTVLVQCLLLALATNALGLSLALGAFISGLVIGASDHHHQAVSEVEPFRDALSSLFFVSIGMLFDVRTITEQPLFLGVALGVVVFGKAVLAFVAIRALGMPSWTSIRAALMLSQVGEFSFVLAQLAEEHALLQVGAKRVFLVVAVASIALTPALFWVGRIVGRGQASARRGNEGGGDHVVVVGFGPAGQGLARSLKEAHIAVRVAEMNPATVHSARRDGVDIIAGDAARISVLEALEIRQARLLVVATNDPESTRRIVQIVRRLAPSVHILVRTSYLAEVPGLERLGADEIVPQELETGVELTARALRHFLVPDDQIERAVAEIRERAYSIRRVGPSTKSNTARLSQYVPGLSVMAFHVEAGSPIANRTLGQAELRRNTGLSVVAIQRGGRTELNIGADSVLQPGDIVIGIGAEAVRARAELQFRGPMLSVAELRPNSN